MPISLDAVQQKLQEEKIDGWLLFAYMNRNPVTSLLLELPEGQIRSRRAFYWIPAKGSPIRLEHKIESRTFAGIPGLKRQYLSYKSLEKELARILEGKRRVAMEYSPHGMLHPMSLVDGGTLELVRDTGTEIVSSAGLVQYFVARLSPVQLNSHLQAAERIRDVARAAFKHVEKTLSEGASITEEELQQWIVQEFSTRGMICDHHPIVARGAHSGNPHHDPRSKHAKIEKNQILLIDLWAKADKQGAVYADQTWMGFTGEDVPEDILQAWTVIRDARRAVRNLVSARFAVGKAVYGWEADDIARNRIAEAGFGEQFVHRTGHNIGVEVHGAGANLDNLETREERKLIPGSVTSVEPGIYTKDWGLRSEFNLVIDLEGEVSIADGTDQDEIIRMKF